ncbi:MAG: hypothetical protein IJI67_07395 [Clostridia bacterium]|nr:hypothetical protein [Clostridia bacterium]
MKSGVDEGLRPYPIEMDKEEMMKTIRLFDEDAFIKEFEAQVLSCEKQGKRYAVVLDKTAFFPEGGGQPADSGTLGGKKVLDVQEQGGVIYHYLKEEITGTVCGKLDWEQRFSRMQNHTGEHIVSGIIHKHTGADNISFSLNDSETTLAFNVPLDAALLAQVEKEANAAVFKNAAVRAYYPDAAILAKTDYRSKLELTENVRLVEIEGTDVCACCAPHCARTGQVGLIKITGSESYKGGTKLWIQCGERALEHYGMLLEQAQSISHLLCAKIEKTAAAVEKLKAAKEAAEYELVGLKRKAVAQAVAAVAPTAGDYLAVCEFKGDDLRLFADSLKEKVGGIIVVLEGDDNSAYRYVMTAKETDIAPLVKAANLALAGKGGGRDNMARGTYCARLEEIQDFFAH